MSGSSPPAPWPVLTCLLLLSAPRPLLLRFLPGATQEPPYLLHYSQGGPLPKVHGCQCVQVRGLEVHRLRKPPPDQLGVAAARRAWWQRASLLYSSLILYSLCTSRPPSVLEEQRSTGGSHLRPSRTRNRELSCEPGHTLPQAVREGREFPAGHAHSWRAGGRGLLKCF